MKELQDLDLKGLRSMFDISMSHAAADPAEVQPFEGVTAVEDLVDPAATRREGLRLIAAGSVAALLLAGGQGTRLGSDSPKGCYDIGMPTHKSLFQYHAEKLAGVKRLAAAHAGIDESAVKLPLLIMTSEPTDAETRSFWAKHEYFGLPSSQVHALHMHHRSPRPTDRQARVCTQYPATGRPDVARCMRTGDLLPAGHATVHGL